MNQNPAQPNTDCPWWLCYAFDNPLRRIIHNPEQILSGLVRPGMQVVDLGCGTGVFTISQAVLLKKG
jgi:predicted RNA methylase